MNYYHNIFQSITELLEACDTPVRPIMNEDGSWQFSIETDNIALNLSVGARVKLQYTAKKYGWTEEAFEKSYEFDIADITGFCTHSSMVVLTTKKKKVCFMFPLCKYELPSYIGYSDSSK